jgi:flavin reductase (DIM6/NTAB) family NADH-FMN oxidoreductase RutF
MDEKAKKHALRLIPYGLYVLTARAGDTVSAATVSWLTQASFDPPRLVVGLRRDTGIWHAVRDAGTFAVNLLGSDQRTLASIFFRHVRPGEDPLHGVSAHLGLTGAPILDDLPAYLECRVVEPIDAGDHTLFLAEIVEAGVHDERQALALPDTGWHYGG